MKSSIYADNASTTQLDPDALEEMLPFMRDGFANPSALHSGAKNKGRGVVIRLRQAKSIERE